MSKHVLHLRSVLEILAAHHLYAKRSKCMFACSKVEYLGHVINTEGVHTDPKKVWPLLKDIKSLRGILGLTGYYRKFVRGYGNIVAPLTALLKEDSFCWSKEAIWLFNSLRKL